MKKKIQKYLSGEREGFSLVELIIVIAIMAILIGVVALAVIPYLEQSRVGKDQQTVDTVYGAFQSAIADQQINQDVTLVIAKDGGTGSSLDISDATKKTAFLNFMAEALNAQAGASDTDTFKNLASGTANKLESKNAAADGKIQCQLKSDTGEITVWAVGDATEIVSSNKGTPTLNGGGE